MFQAVACTLDLRVDVVIAGEDDLSSGPRKEIAAPLVALFSHDVGLRAPTGRAVLDQGGIGQGLRCHEEVTNCQRFATEVIVAKGCEVVRQCRRDPLPVCCSEHGVGESHDDVWVASSGLRDQPAFIGDEILDEVPFRYPGRDLKRNVRFDGSNAGVGRKGNDRSKGARQNSRLINGFVDRPSFEPHINPEFSRDRVTESGLRPVGQNANRSLALTSTQNEPRSLTVGHPHRRRTLQDNDEAAGTSSLTGQFRGHCLSLSTTCLHTRA